MKDLIEALMILSQYAPANSRCPLHCEHDELRIMDVNPASVSKEHIRRLDELGIFAVEDEDVFMSFRFGSA